MPHGNVTLKRTCYTHVLDDLVISLFMFQPNKAKGGTSIANVSVCAVAGVIRIVVAASRKHPDFLFEISLNISGCREDCVSGRCRMKQVSHGVKTL